MIKHKKIWVLAVLVFPIIAVVAIVSFYYNQQNYADWVQEEYGIDDGQYNAIKHATAAADIYNGFQSIGLSANLATNLIDQLGKTNESVEQLFRNHDSTLEMMKDLYNNGVGFNAARWFSQNDCKIKQTSAAQILIVLTQHNILANTPEALRWQKQPLSITTHSKNLGTATRWYDSKRKDIKNLVFSFLNQRFCKEGA